MRHVLVTGGFDPLHSGHIDYFKAAKQLGNTLTVGLNSDEWLTRKKGRPFLPFEERKAIIQELKCVDSIISFNDNDDSACNAIYRLLSKIPSGDKVIFANGGDRNQNNTPEFKTYGQMPWVDFVHDVGGSDKKNSSSWILDEWKTQKTERDWGYWRVLDDKQPRVGQKVKELVINPGCSLSNQKHLYRSEFWYVLEGDIEISLVFPNKEWQIQMLSEHTQYVIPAGVWHKTTNIGSTPAHIVEIQYGEKCIEEDIERKDG